MTTPASPRPTDSSTPSGGRKFVYGFGAGLADGDGSMKSLLGGKGANLAEMTRIGLPVPPGFTISTEVCTHYYANDLSYPDELAAEVRAALTHIESASSKKFGSATDPLLISVRSGARESMPGMMDTILNLGMNDATVEAVAAKSGNPRFAWDSYRRFIQMYGEIVLGIEPRSDELHSPFHIILDALRRRVGAADNAALSVENLQELVASFQALTIERTGAAFPQDPHDQLWGAIGAVFGSWENDRARVYRRKYSIPRAWGTAVTVQTMVFGNRGDRSATGVAFTRNPANGENEFYGEYLINAQGEDVVAGIRTPHAIAQFATGDWGSGGLGVSVQKANLVEGHGRGNRRQTSHGSSHMGLCGGPWPTPCLSRFFSGPVQRNTIST